MNSIRIFHVVASLLAIGIFGLTSYGVDAATTSAKQTSMTSTNDTLDGGSALAAALGRVWHEVTQGDDGKMQKGNSSGGMYRASMSQNMRAFGLIRGIIHHCVGIVRDFARAIRHTFGKFFGWSRSQSLRKEPSGKTAFVSKGGDSTLNLNFHSTNKGAVPKTTDVVTSRSLISSIFE